MLFSLNKNENINNVCSVLEGKPCVYVVFGASGDLTKRKLISSFFSLYNNGRLKDDFLVLGFARTKMTTEVFRENVKTILENFTKHNEERRLVQEKIDFFCERCFYFSGSYETEENYHNLAEYLQALIKKSQIQANMVFHIATPPSLYEVIVANLGKSGLLKEGLADEKNILFRRVIFEKPFGTNLESALLLDKNISQYLKETQIYRIDHYLGKETVQNILMFRFTNHIFEPVWCAQNIEQIQITVAEELGVEHRAGYFDQAGLLRDMFQNHILQLMALIAMDKPKTFNNQAIQTEKLKFMQAIKPFDLEKINEQFVRGQYTDNTISDQFVRAYREEKGVKTDSVTETYFAMKLFVDNKRWQGVPFYIKAGKALKEKQTQITVVFKNAPYCLFQNSEENSKKCFNNILIFDIQPKQGVSFVFQAKIPGAKLCTAPVTMHFDYQDLFSTQELADDYATVILDCILGEQMLYWSKECVEESWKLLTPLLNILSDTQKIPLYFYKAGSNGPIETDFLIKN